MNTNKKCLLVVDVQNDFCPGGSLPVPDGDKVIPVINKLMSKFELVIFTKDWHPADMKAFASNRKNKKPFDTYKYDGETHVLWPDHCVQNTPGADLHKDLNLGDINGEFYIFKKGTDSKYHPYSGFGGTELAEFLREKEVDDVFVTGLALDYCCVDTAIDASHEGFKTVMVIDATRPINENIDETLIKLSEANVKIIESWELPLFNLGTAII